MVRDWFSLKYWLSTFRRISVSHLLPDIFILISSMYIALYLRVPDDTYWLFFDTVHFYVPIVVGIQLICLVGFGCYSVMWRYISVVDSVRLAKAIALALGLSVLVTFFLPDKIARPPRSIYMIDALLVGLGLMGIRMLRRIHYESRTNRSRNEGSRNLIYGAGSNGRLLANRFKSDGSLLTHLVGFIDDDPKKLGVDINGVQVLGHREDLRGLIEKFQISQLIIAIPDISGELLREIVQVTRPYNIRPRITTQLTQDKLDRRSVEIYRPVELPDLLNRKPREIDLTPVREMIRGRRVLVTGAGGSIGSELARQIMSHEPGRLMLLDHSEYNLYEIDQELRLSTQNISRVVPLLIDLKDERSMRLAMLEYTPEIVFHAAAYKHVHLVENNPYLSLLNNVQGTQILLELCKEIGVETFVMISTDKAVNPAGVMGATKRVCELLVTSQALETGRNYCSVRFGNVLGSSGSLIPLLQNQITQGGPVTVTHPDMTRFFMLIPEAVSLVLTAATIANPGDINVLRMGEPVKIVDIVRSLIALMGKTEEEVPIVFTGMRPGEKMFEELYIRGDELQTEDPDILTLPHGDSQLHLFPEERKRVQTLTARIIEHSKEGSKQAIFELNQLVQSKYFQTVTEGNSLPKGLSSKQNH